MIMIKHYERIITTIVLIIMVSSFHKSNSFSLYQQFNTLPITITSKCIENKRSVTNVVALLQTTKFTDSFSREERDHQEQHDYPLRSDYDETPEIRILSEALSYYENKLANLRQTCTKLQNLNEYYSESGYAHLLSEMDNISRRTMQDKPSPQSNSIAPTINAINYFIPSWEQLYNLQQNAYKNNDFAQKYYFALSFQNAFKQLNIVEYMIKPGEYYVDNDNTEQRQKRIKIISKEYSNMFHKDVIIRTAKVGLEYQIMDSNANTNSVNDNYILCPAECVVSLGLPPRQQRQQQQRQESNIKTDAFGRRIFKKNNSNTYYSSREKNNYDKNDNQRYDRNLY